MGHRSFLHILGMGATFILLAGCTNGSGTDNSEVELGVDPIRDACSQALEVANSEPSLSALTQCEVQTDGPDRIFILQFADPSEDRMALGQGTNVDTIFIQPLNALREVWDTASTDSGIEKYIVSFQDPCKTVWDLDRELVEGFITGQQETEIVADTMIITTFLC